VSPGRAAIVEGWPVFVTALVVGTAFGLTARQSGLSVAETSATSVIVFAGAAQFVMVDLLRAEIGAAVVVVAVAAWRRNLLFAVIAGVIVVAALRSVGL